MESVRQPMRMRSKDVGSTNAGVYAQALVEGIPNLMSIPYILGFYRVLGVIGDIPSTLLLGFGV